MTVFLVPGLGADERVFAALTLVLPIVILRWEPPKSAAEPLAQYARRLAIQIPVNESCWLVGVSFGGVMALELAQLRPLAKVVVISSVVQPAQFPALLRVARVTGLHRLVFVRLGVFLPGVMQWIFGVEEPGHRALLRQIIGDTDPRFARWAISQLVCWQGVNVMSAFRIHGTHDRLLPAVGLVDYWVDGGGHLMVVTHAPEISVRLNRLFISG